MFPKKMKTMVRPEGVVNDDPENGNQEADIAEVDEAESIDNAEDAQMNSRILQSKRSCWASQQTMEQQHQNFFFTKANQSKCAKM